MTPHWLNRERLTLYPRIFLALYGVAALALVLLSHGGVDPLHRPLGCDFITYWAASHLALGGHAALAYDLPSIVQAERAVIPGINTINPWLYPPSFLLLVLPLALLPYFVSFALFLGGSFAAYLAVVRRIAAKPGSLMPILAFPGVFMNALQGQNAFLTAALAGGALLLLPRRPAWAGLLIAVLTIKPQLGLLWPVALLCGRHWRALASAVAGTLALTALSLAVFGTATLHAFFDNLPLFSAAMVQSPKLMWKMPSLFGLAYSLGAPMRWAYVAHAVLVLPVAAAVGWAWSRRGDAGLRGALLVTGALLASPYVLDYDLAWLALPLAWLARHGLDHGWLKGEREVLAAAWLTPLLVGVVTQFSGVQLGPLPLLLLFLAIVRRLALPAPAPSAAA